jgi:hypothetical protein
VRRWSFLQCVAAQKLRDPAAKVIHVHERPRQEDEGKNQQPLLCGLAASIAPERLGSTVQELLSPSTRQGLACLVLVAELSSALLSSE